MSHRDTKPSNSERGCVCQHCGAEYRVDVMVPDDLWERIKPSRKPKGAGLLCGLCVFARIEALGEFGALFLQLGAAPTKPTRVVNVRGAEPYDVYVGRGPDPRDRTVFSGWGNPFSVGQHGRHGCMRLYLGFLAERPSVIEAIRRELRGKVLGCWCKPGLCHGDVLARVADGESVEEVRRDVLSALAETRSLFGGGE